jgi:hypothetical protein
MKREMFGLRSERSQRLIDQLELQLEELAAAAGEDEVKARAARVTVQGFTRRQAASRRITAWAATISPAAMAIASTLLAAAGYNFSLLLRWFEEL